MDGGREVEGGEGITKGGRYGWREGVMVLQREGGREAGREGGRQVDREA